MRHGRLHEACGAKVTRKDVEGTYTNDFRRLVEWAQDQKNANEVTRALEAIGFKAIREIEDDNGTNA